jgi:uncharacterized membrane protein
MSISRRFSQFSMLLVGLFISSFISMGQADGNVYAVLFFSPSCPHCHQLMLEELPPIQEQFGDALVIFFVDVTTENGSAMAQSAYSHYNIPSADWVVPMMVVNEQVLIGGSQIPSELPIITQMGIENSGIPIPSFPLMQVAFEQWQAQNSSPIPSEVSVIAPSSPLIESFKQDALASTITIVILIGLIISVVGLVATRQSGLPVFIPKVIIVVATLIAFFIAITITLADQHDTLALPIARLTFIGMIIAAIITIIGHRVQVTVSLMTFLGIAVSAYMAYIEITANPAVCGVIGDCNAVQQSDYAQLMGIPIGVIGMIGYLLMFVMSIAINRIPDVYHQQLLTLLKVLVGASALFTIYLTFLEPFVIGAVCAWCLLSSLIVLNLMWLVIPMVHDEKHKPTPYLLHQAT